MRAGDLGGIVACKIKRQGGNLFDGNELFRRPAPVADGGPGFDPKDVRPTSLGLAGLEGRVESLGGTFEINPNAPGTIVRMSIGFEETEQA